MGRAFYRYWSDSIAILIGRIVAHMMSDYRIPAMFWMIDAESAHAGLERFNNFVDIEANPTKLGDVS